MAKLTESTRPRVQGLLEQYDSTLAALAKVGKRGFFQSMNVTNDGNDFSDVSLQPGIAANALHEQKVRIEAQLKKFGIEIAS